MINHQEAPEAPFRDHFKEVVTMLRTAFSDLHFEVHHALAEGDVVSLHSPMTGTYHGRFNFGSLKDLPPTGRRDEVKHMHFLRWQDSNNTDIWHLWDTARMMRQLSVVPGAPQAAVERGGQNVQQANA